VAAAAPVKANRTTGISGLERPMTDRVSQVGGANAGITLRMKTTIKTSAVSGNCLIKSVIVI
jgi:hypothetical protein